MRGESDPSADPYRALGLQPGASMAEVKRAYRLLAKAFHPDSAGEAALPRFLAIRAAYEQLKTGRIASSPRAAGAGPTPPAEPWRADPARARAARERARTARAGAAKPGPATGTTGTTGSTASAASGGPSGRSGSAGSTGPADGSRGAGRRHVRKATMGSTSYDEARDARDATWSGASWYGPSSGEYWIVNPREYADPRKHGPEYQQRARRPLEDEALAAVDGASSTWADRPPIREARADAGTTAPPSGREGRTPAGTRGGAQRPSAGWGPPSTDAAASVGTRWDRLGEAPPDRLPEHEPAVEASGWLGGRADDPIRRLGLALVAWPPIGLAAAAAIDDVTGCSVYAAKCTGSEPLLPWLAQAVILGLLLLLPPVTRLLAGGALAVLLALVPITAFLVAVGGTGAPEAAPTLAVLLGVAWLLGIGWAAASFRQRRTARAGP